MDGVGGTLKREADRAVLHGKDIIDAGSFIRALSGLDIYLIEIGSKNIADQKKQLSWNVIPPIEGITKCHQITFVKGGKMYGNMLSCFTCPMAGPCKHYRLFEGFPELPVLKRKLKVENVWSSDSDDCYMPEVEETSFDNMKNMDVPEDGVDVFDNGVDFLEDDNGVLKDDVDVLEPVNTGN